MTGNEVREKYLKFFEKRGHKRISPAPLVLKDDPTTLFTSSGMQPLVPYLMGKKYPDGGKRLVDSQPSFRAQDIEEVGDNRHTTFFEMLGNWSLGDYFKKEQIPWIWEFVTRELKLEPARLYVSVFEGNEQVPFDTESFEIWKSLGVPESHIFKYGVKKNWWSRAGIPDVMPIGEIGGPDSEIFFEFESVKHDSKFGEKCHPNCDCGRFMEIGNSVFMQYKKTANGLEELPNKNVDFGGGLERLTAATNNDPDVFWTDLFWPIIGKVTNMAGVAYIDDSRNHRIIADHMKAATFLIANGITPSNKMQGYILRRLIRRAVLALRKVEVPESYVFYNGDEHFESIYYDIVHEIFNVYKDSGYLENVKPEEIIKTIEEEAFKFSRNLKNGVSRMEKTDPKEIDEKFAFDLMQSEGFPFEITAELAKEKGIEIDKNKFDELLREHQELSRKSSEKKFGIK